MSIEVMKQALEALDGIHPGNMTPMAEEAWKKAIAALRQAISEAKQAQPVAWRTFDGEDGYEFRDYENNEDYGDWWAQLHPNHLNWVDPLYTAPLYRQPLTDEEILAIARDHYNPYQRPVISFTRAIEAAYGIKETK